MPSPALRTRLVFLAVAVAALALLMVLLTSVSDTGGRPDAAPTARVRLTATSGPVRIVAVGDIACEPGVTRTATGCSDDRTAALTARIAPDKILGLGDMQYSRGSYSQFTNAYDTYWGRFNTIMKPIPGNHEYRTAGASGYYRYFAAQQPGAPGYYSFALGGWRVYQLNSNCASIGGPVNCSAELAWFKRRLATAPKCTIMTMHHPRYSSGEHGSQTVMRPFWRAAYKHHVDIAFAGHDHDYERFARMNGDGAVRRGGVMSFVSGAGGKELYPVGNPRSGSRFVDEGHHGVLEMSLDYGAFSWVWHTIEGTTPDSGTGKCV